MPSLNGNYDTALELKRLGIPTQYVTFWWGPWSTASTMDAQLAKAKAIGLTPHLQFFYIGDELCAEIVRGERSFPDYGGKMQSRASWWDFINLAAARLKASGLPRALVNLETEWNKKGPHLPSDTHSVLDDPASFDDLWARMAWTLKNQSGATNVDVVTSPGSWGGPWGDVGATLQRFPKVLAVADYVGTQCLRSIPAGAHAVGQSYSTRAAKYDGGPDALISALKALRRVAGDKRLLVTDTAFSSYGGHYKDGKNAEGEWFPDGAGGAEESRQRRAFERLLQLKSQMELLDVEAFFYRSVRDAASMDAKNYHGYAERHWGVTRADGTKKPAFDYFRRFGKY